MSGGVDDEHPTTRRRSSRITLADVAKAARVSRATASVVLNGRSEEMRIAAATQTRVRRAADDLGYQPNQAAQTLRTGRTGVIALVSDSMSSMPFATASIRGALDVARERQMTILVAETMGDQDLEQRLLGDLLARDVDGFMYGTMVTSAVEVPDQLKGVPTVLLNAFSDDDVVSAVIPDERGAGRDAAQAILDAGHRDDIWLLGGAVEPGGEWPWAADVRFGAITDTLAAAGAAATAPIMVGGWDPPHGRAAMTRHLRSHPAPQALICANDRLAFGALQALGPTVLPGRDISIVSFDDTDLASWVDPPLASLSLPYYEMGRVAAGLLVDGDTSSGVQRLPMTMARTTSLRQATPSGSAAHGRQAHR